MTPLRTTSVLFASLLPLLLAGCVISTSSDTHVCGRQVEPTLLDQVKPGMTADQVRGLLGDPVERRSASDGTELWVWSYRRVDESKTAILFLFGGRDKDTVTQTTTVELRDGLVVRARQS